MSEHARKPCSGPFKAKVALRETVRGDDTMLRVEDHEATVWLLRFILERDGDGVTRVRDVRMAQNLISTSQPPDRILLDIVLPSLTGSELLRLLRTTPQWPWIHVILLTVESRSETMKKAVHLEFAKYVLKHFAPDRWMKPMHQFYRGQTAIKISIVEAREMSVAANVRGKSRRLHRQVRQRQRTEVETGTRVDRTMWRVSGCRRPTIRNAFLGCHVFQTTCTSRSDAAEHGTPRNLCKQGGLV